MTKIEKVASFIGWIFGSLLVVASGFVGGWLGWQTEGPTIIRISLAFIAVCLFASAAAVFIISISDL